MLDENLDKKIKRLERENDILKRENKYLKKLTTSKRFMFAEKIATGYNGIFPKNTKRRNCVEKFGRYAKNIIEIRQTNQDRRIKKKIRDMANGHENVIVLNSVPWDLKLKQRPHHLATEFSKLGFFVVYLERDNVLQSFRVIKKNLITVNSEKYLTNLPKTYKMCYLLSPNNMPTHYEVLKNMVDLGYKFIYDYLDEFHEDISGDLSIQMEVWDKLKSLKPVLCLTTAERLYNELRRHLGNKQRIIMVRNAVNVEHFDFEKNMTSTPPSDLAVVVKNGRPIVGFYGALAPWIDFGLLNEAASKHPEWNFVYIGVDYNGAAADLKAGKNVYNLGAKNYDALQKYTKYFSCAIIPFKRGEIAKATSPVKLFEYMAAGLPTVCTRDLKECSGYDFVYMSKDEEEFMNNIANAIQDGKNNESRKVLLGQAKENTWAKRAQSVVDNLN